MKRSHTEDEWFAKHERDLIEDLKRERFRREQRVAEALQQEEARKRKELHWLHCPKCGSQMKEEPVVHDRKVERCTLCGGLFFDRGELEDILFLSEEERKGFRIGILHLVLPFWKTHKTDDEKILIDFHADQEKRKAQLAEKLTDPNAKKEQELHRMNCPKCGSAMKAVDLGHELELDECTLCRGVFLDYGELEVIRAFSDEERKAIRNTLLKLGIS